MAAFEFLQQASRDLGLANGEPIQSFFKTLKMPMPAKDGYWRTRVGADEKDDVGLIIPLNAVGCILRIYNSNRARRIVHPHIVQPLGSIEIDKIRFDIDPGLICPVVRGLFSKEHDLLGPQYDFLNQRLGSNIKFEDSHEYNIGYVPGTKTENGYPLTLVVDLSAVLVLSRSLYDIKKLVAPTDTQAPHQATFYAPLYEIFDDAWGNGIERCKPRDMKRVWQKCSEFKEQKKLRTRWNSACLSENLVPFREIGRRYAEAWSPAL